MPARTTLKIHSWRTWRLCTVQSSGRAKGRVQTFSRQQITILRMSCLHTEMGKALKVPPRPAQARGCVFHLAWHSSGACRQENAGGHSANFLRTRHCFTLKPSTAITFSATNPALLLQVHPSVHALGSRAWPLQHAGRGCATRTGRYSDTGWLKAVETMGMKKEKKIF